MFPRRRRAFGYRSSLCASRGDPQRLHFSRIPRIFQGAFTPSGKISRGALLAKNVYVTYGEGVIATMLNNVLARFPQLLLGSYPVLDNPAYKVKVTLESKDAEYLSRALQTFLSSLPDGAVHRIE